MSKTETVPRVIERLFAARTYITSAEVAAAAGISRQAAHYNLKKMAEGGLLIAEGARRSSRYRLKAQRSSSFEISGLNESDVWSGERTSLRKIEPDILDTPNLVQLLTFTFTEMLNNAIDHSKGTTVDVRWFLDQQKVSFEIDDDGIGAFASIRESLMLADDYQAVGELSKGKQTADPAHHSGLGIFFTSKMVERFALSANQLIWIVNNDIGDFAIGSLDKPRTGTLVRCEIRRDTLVTPKEIFDEQSDPVSHRFNKTMIHVGLFREGDFVSRTEAKLIGARLEGFDLIELDFAGIGQIGQGFADELFRVWANEHPSSRLIPVNANPAVIAMIAAVRS